MRAEATAMSGAMNLGNRVQLNLAPSLEPELEGTAHRRRHRDLRSDEGTASDPDFIVRQR
jgi:hypothetical protein